jgi:hypothetical protein
LVPFAERFLAVVGKVEVPPVLPPLFDVLYIDRGADDPKIAGVATAQLHFERLRPDAQFARASRVHQNAVVAAFLRPPPLEREDVVLKVVLFGDQVADGLAFAQELSIRDRPHVLHCDAGFVEMMRPTGEVATIEKRDSFIGSK